MASKQWPAIQKLRETLLGIQGLSAGYWTNVGDRVYLQFRDPTDRAGLAMPYICIFRAGRSSTETHLERALVDLTAIYTIVAYDETRAPGGYSSDLVEKGIKLEEDIWKALLGNITLDKTVAEMTLSGPTVSDGSDPDRRWLEVRFEVLLRFRLQSSQLGP